MKNKRLEAYALLKKATREFSKAHSTKADFVRDCMSEMTRWVNRCFASCPQDASHEKCGEICVRKAKCFYNECCANSADPCTPVDSYWDPEFCPARRGGPNPSDPSRGHSTLKDAIRKRKNTKKASSKQHGPVRPGQFLGACCLDGDCIMMKESDCEREKGNWEGGPCTPDLCITPPSDVGACCRYHYDNFMGCENKKYEECKEWCGQPGRRIHWTENSHCVGDPGDFDHCVVGTHGPGGSVRGCPS